MLMLVGLIVACLQTLLLYSKDKERKKERKKEAKC